MQVWDLLERGLQACGVVRSVAFVTHQHAWSLFFESCAAHLGGTQQSAAQWAAEDYSGVGRARHTQGASSWLLAWHSSSFIWLAGTEGINHLCIVLSKEAAGNPALNGTEMCDYAARTGQSICDLQHQRIRLVHLMCIAPHQRDIGHKSLQRSFISAYK